MSFNTQQPKIYSPGDFKTMRQDIFDQALDALKDSTTYENEQYELSLGDLEYAGGIPKYSRKQQKEAVQHGRSLVVPVRGRWTMKDKATGEVVSTSAMRKVMDVPYMTERGTFIRNGSEYTLPIQMRLVPGVYSLIAENGEAKAQINTKPGTGRPMTMWMNPSNPIFKIRVGTRNHDLYPLLKHMGISDELLKEAWGKDIHKINMNAYAKAGGGYSGDEKFKEAYEKIAEDVFGGKIDPVNAKMTFGESFDTITPELLQIVSNRLLRLTKGEIEPDNRDSLENQRFVAAPELISERIRRDAGGVMRGILWRASRDGNVDRITTAPLTKYIHSLFNESNLAQVIEQTNLLDAYARATKVTRMGEGGIGSIDSAPMSARMVHDTYKGFIDCVATPESLRVGLDSQIAATAQKGSDGLLYSPLIDPKTGKTKLVSSIESSVVPVSFGEYRTADTPLIPAMVGNSIRYLPKEEVRYFTPSGDHLFALSSNYVPLKSGIKAGRLLMAQKHQTQAMSLKDRMAPYVQTADPEDPTKSIEEKYNNVMGAVTASQAGKVLSVDSDEIVVRQADGSKETYSLYNNFPLNRRSLVHNNPVVKPGDVIKPGQLLASSNYTDDKGTSALGTQLRIGWIGYKGYNNLDGIVISESAAKKLTSQYLYEHTKDKDDNIQFGKDIFIGAFPTKFTKEQLDTIDDNGIVKVGTILNRNDPMILAASKRKPGPQTMFRALSKDDSIVWSNDFPGKVVDVVESKDGFKVFTEAYVPAQVGDKLSSRFASKGTVSYILPDSQMPIAPDGRPLEILKSPTGIVSRVNSAQLIEAALGKVAEKTGKTYKLPGFMDQSLVDFALDELKKANMDEKEDLTDPESGTIIPQVMTGSAYIIKFHHTSESKEGARSTGGYTADELPAGTGTEASKTLGGLLLGAFVGHDSSEILKDMTLIKGQKNTDFWRSFRSGQTPSTPKTPLVFEKFINHLQGAGIRVDRGEKETNIFALTKDDIDQMAKGEVITADTFDSKTFTAQPGGLFDPAIFGPDGRNWGYISLPEPIPNPIMEEPIRVMLGLKESELREVLAGTRELPNKQTGGEGLVKYLRTINPKIEIANALKDIRSSKGAKRNNAVKRLRYFSAMDRQNVTPDQFMLDKIPVLPPVFRRITEIGGMMMIPDANYLYKSMMDTKEDLQNAKESGVPAELLGEGRLNLYDSFKAVTGLGEPTVKQLQEKDVGGLLRWVFGKGSPKMGGFQRMVVGGKVDVTGRSVINVDPKLRLDETGLPENQAWGLYKDFTIRKLVQSGMDVLQATKDTVNRTDRAREAMLKVMEERPLIVTRAPALHKFSVAAFRPKLIKGHTLLLNPVVYGTYSGDNDGDAVTYYVPVSKKAVQDAYNKMLPSKTLLAARRPTAHYLPQEEYILGAAIASRPGKGPVVRTFKTEQEAITAYRKGEIDVNDNIQITGA